MVALLQSQSPILDKLPTPEQVRDRLEATAAERRALRSLLRVLKQAALAKAEGGQPANEKRIAVPRQAEAPHAAA